MNNIQELSNSRLVWTTKIGKILQNPVKSLLNALNVALCVCVRVFVFCHLCVHVCVYLGVHKRAHAWKHARLSTGAHGDQKHCIPWSQS